jgi:hypothetical protein
LHLFFDSDRPGGLDSRDFYVASRLDTGDPFGPAQPIAELNTDSSDSDAWLSDDLRHIVFASDRSGDWEIYEALR